MLFNAGSLARPLKAAADSFAAREGVTVQQEHAGSLETARKLTDLGKTPDVIALADAEVFRQLLVPVHTPWYAVFARNRMTIAWRPGRAGVLPDSAHWPDVLLASGVRTGRSDPQLDPNGYRTLLVLQLAERHYRRPGLADSLRRAMGDNWVRPKEADLVALLEAGEVDYIWTYESMARALRWPHVKLPDAVDLGAPADSVTYGAARVTVRGAGVRDSATFIGQPILYAMAIPAKAPHPALAERFVRFLLSADGRRILRAEGLDALEQPTVMGAGAPSLTMPTGAR